ncbi:hypothetical protein B0T26DRAFT_27676 [Lasiosphaeria miniovina]|uniref:MARVEL domain-containing protein n=1 Tax=Lasiosphaeria miniovina TaxID=1954250 RepID=A0AA40BG20_9PEZI|nr:uncharacterized protein B0T26DRAFT_27676 [Lasiosphaeria miniovina]KAK0733584.1 hypothetical protein B0T26DRAFT_27676 [Lasiosphaeria miniovina]
MDQPTAAPKPIYSAVRAPGHEHIPLYPPYFIILRMVQLGLAVLIMALDAYGVSVLSTDGNSFVLAVAIMNLITGVYFLVTHYFYPNIYNYWAILGLDILLIIMWLSSFALLASEVNEWYSSVGHLTAGQNVCNGVTCSKVQQSYIAAPACLAAAASFGAVEFVLHIVSLVFHSMALHRHRAAGLHCMPAGSSMGGGFGGGAVSAEKSQQAYQQVPLQDHQQHQQVYPVYAQQQQQQQAYPVQVQQPQQLYNPTVSPPPQQPYAPPQQPQQPYYPQQQQPQVQPQPAVYHAAHAPALVPQQTGGSYVSQPSQQQPYDNNIPLVPQHTGGYVAQLATDREPQHFAAQLPADNVGYYGTSAATHSPSPPPMQQHQPPPAQ